MIISKDFKFEAAHHLNDYVGKCANVHGHSYFGTIWIEGELDKVGFVMDYGDIKTIIDYFDHKDLNTLPEFEVVNPTAEIIALVIKDKIKGDRTDIEVAVKLHETESSSAFVTTNKALNYLA
jgi:6-pyruvoyltetrahydropterin/6-carboxytetrahydropterin synthase